MLTRLRVKGFKNLVDVDVRFGPFTCIAGANGVGKSNLFDAIHFLSALADRPLIDAALSVRDEGGRTADVRSLFHRVGDDFDPEMSFEAEMIVPRTGFDDLGQEAKASITFLRYAITLAYRSDGSRRSLGGLELLKEELSHITLGEARQHLEFEHSAEWRKSAVQGQRRVPNFISTEGEGEHRVIKLHQDGGSSGRPLSRSAANLPRTVLSVANAAESPTAVLALREMQSWRLLQLEPSALRRPDDFKAPPRMGADGSHLAATLFHLARPDRRPDSEENFDDVEGTRIYAQVAGRLSDLIEDVRDVWVDVDDKRELLTLQVIGRDGTAHPARALSDGTLRFLALAVIARDPEARGVLCLEEPENGIHPDRIPAMLRLLQDIATDPYTAIDQDNPLRQVIINTHSPKVVSQMDDRNVLVAETKEMVRSGRRFQHVVFSCLSDTWRARAGVATVAKGKLQGYLGRSGSEEVGYNTNGHQNGLRTKHGNHPVRRVIDRPDLQLLIPYTEEAE